MCAWSSPFYLGGSPFHIDRDERKDLSKRVLRRKRKRPHTPSGGCKHDADAFDIGCTIVLRGVYGLTDSSAAAATLSNSASSCGLAPLSPATTSRAHRMYSRCRLTVQSCGGL